MSVVPVWSLRHKYLETLIHTPLALVYARLFLHPSIVHLHALGPAFFTPFAKLLGFKTIVTHHAPDYERPKWGRLGRLFLRLGETLAVVFADRVICVADFLRKRLVQRHPNAAERTETIRNGACVRETGAETNVLSALNLSPRNYVLGVGRLDEVKGFHDLIAAFKAARPKGQKLVVVGGAFVDSCYARAIASEASDDIVLAGFRSFDDLCALYRNASLLVHPSYMEGYSLVVAEALAAGAPVLISDIPAHREFGLAEDCYFRAGDIEGLARLLGDWSGGTCSPSTGERIRRENDWDASACKLRSCIRELADAPLGLKWSMALEWMKSISWSEGRAVRRQAALGSAAPVILESGAIIGADHSSSSGPP